jgi:hypothetical protein
LDRDQYWGVNAEGSFDCDTGVERRALDNRPFRCRGRNDPNPDTDDEQDAGDDNQESSHGIIMNPRAERQPVCLNLRPIDS